MKMMNGVEDRLIALGIIQATAYNRIFDHNSDMFFTLEKL
jgi:hypothetical protein